MKKLTLIIAIAVFAAGTAVSQTAEEDAALFPRQRMLYRMDGMAGARMSGGLMIPDLSDEQAEQIQALHIEHLAAMKPVNEQIAEKRLKLRHASTAGKVNQSELDNMIDEIGTLRVKAEKMRSAHRQEVRKLLTEEQRIMFDSRGRSMGVGRGMGIEGRTMRSSRAAGRAGGRRPAGRRF